MKHVLLKCCGLYLSGCVAVYASDCPCSEPSEWTCVEAGTVIWTDPLAVFQTCATTIVINNTVTGYKCVANASGYRRTELPDPNWVSETKFVRKWVGNAQTGFCKVTTIPLEGQNYDCVRCVFCEIPGEKCNPG